MLPSSPFNTHLFFLTLGLCVVMTNSKTGSSMTQLLGRQRSESPKHREQGKPPSPMGYDCSARKVSGLCGYLFPAEGGWEVVVVVVMVG